MELTCPGVPVTAWASMRPSASNTPAERSPASRTDVENAVRTKVCACSSTTAMSRLHMICVWICDNAAFDRSSMARLSELGFWPLVTTFRFASCQPLVKVPPIRVRPFDERQFLFARPGLDLLLALDGARHVVVPLVPDEKFAAIARRKARQQAFPMLPSALHQIGGNAGVERTIALDCFAFGSQ